MPTLLLFDIDGTLVLTGGAGARAMDRAFESVFQVRDAFGGIPMPGRTDPLILDDALARAGIGADSAAVARFRERYEIELADELAQSSPGRAIMMAGVRELLEILVSRRDVFLALLTGNYSEAARIKLTHFDLWRYFRCGAYGEDARERSALVPVAVARARACGMPRMDPDRMIVIGDTPLDVACARVAGVRSIAVMTGGCSAAALRLSGAEAVLEDLSDAGAFLRLIEEPAPSAVRGAGEPRAHESDGLS